VWCVVWLVVLSLGGGKSGRYAIVLYPMLAWVGALWLVHGAPRWIAMARRGFVRWGPAVMLAGSVATAAIGVRVHAPAPAHWDALCAFVRAHEHEDVWAGRDMMWTSANVYLFTGRWPRTVTEARVPPAGALRLYRDGVREGPGPGEAEVWRSGPMFAARSGVLR
jgi:hypothetical protein